MRQQQHQPAAAAPFGLAGTQELVDHYLRAVGEVAELRLPDHQLVRAGGGEAVFEGQHRLLGQHRVEAVESGLLLLQVLQRPPGALVPLFALLVVKGSVAMEESAAADVLAGDSDVVSRGQQRRIREVLAHAPIDRQLAGAHLATVVDDLLHARMQRKVRRRLGKPLGQAQQFLLRHCGVALFRIRCLDVRRPVRARLALEVGDDRVDQSTAFVQRGTESLDHPLGVIGADDALCRQLVGVKLARAGMGIDLLVHQRLGHHRLVLLVMTELAEADDVDHDVGTEFVPELHRHLRDEGHGFRIVAIDMEDRRLDHLEDVGAIERGPVVAQIGRGKADLVVHDQVHRAAGPVAARLREVERFLVDALAGHGGVAMDQHRHHFPLAVGAAAHLPRIDRAAHYGIDDLQVRGIEGQRQVHRPAGRGDVGRIAHVVLHVSGDKHLFLLAFEFLEQHFRLLAQRVDQHIQPPAVGHADHHFLHAERAAAADQLVHRHDQRFAAFEREALLTDVFGVQVAFQRLGGSQPFQQTLLVVGGKQRRGADRLQARLNPALLADVRKVHVFGTDGPAVGLSQRFEDLAQVRLDGTSGKRAAMKALPEVRLGETVIRRIELGQRRPVVPLERVKLSPSIAQEAVGIDQLQYLDLLLVVLRQCAHRRLQRAFLRALREGGNYRRVRNVRRRRLPRPGQCAQLVEVVAPGGFDRARVIQVALVELLDERRVGAEQVGVRQHLSHHVVTSLCGVRLKTEGGRPPSVAYRLSIVGTSRLTAPIYS